LIAGIHDIFSSNWIIPIAARDLSKLQKTATDKASEMKVKIAARRLIVPDDRPGKKAIKIAPTIGRKIIVVRYGKSN